MNELDIKVYKKKIIIIAFLSNYNKKKNYSIKKLTGLKKKLLKCIFFSM